jgi:type IV pilus assembly protein PilC
MLIASNAGASQNMSSSTSIQTRVVPLFYHKLSSMLVAGVSLESALIDLDRQNRTKSFQNVISGLRESTARGNPLSVSMQAFPNVFLAVHANIIHAAETMGKLPEALEDIAVAIDAQTRIRRKIIRAIIYPCIVLGIAGIVMTILLIFVLPSFQEMYVGYDAELPRPTQILLKIKEIIVRYGGYVALAIIVLILALKACRATLLGRVVSDWLRLHLPIAGDLNRKLATVRFARTYAQMLRAGVPIVKALTLAGGATGNTISEQVIVNAAKRVQQGDPLSDAMQSQKIFPALLVEMLQSGEKTGKTDEMLDNLAQLYDEEVSVTVDGLTILLQPFLIVILGIVIGGTLIAILMPWLTMPSVISM